MQTLQQEVIYEKQVWKIASINNDGSYILVKPARLGFIHAFRVFKKDFKFKKKLQN